MFIIPSLLALFLLGGQGYTTGFTEAAQSLFSVPELTNSEREQLKTVIDKINGGSFVGGLIIFNKKIDRDGCVFRHTFNFAIEDLLETLELSEEQLSLALSSSKMRGLLSAYRFKAVLVGFDFGVDLAANTALTSDEKNILFTHFCKGIGPVINIVLAAFNEHPECTQAAQENIRKKILDECIALFQRSKKDKNV